MTDTTLSPDQIDACQRIGRNEADNNTTIGLPELDALCHTARRFHEVNEARMAAQAEVSALRSLLRIIGEKCESADTIDGEKIRESRRS